MLILSNTLKTFNCKVNKIKSLAKKKYYLQETLNRIKFIMRTVLPELKLFKVRILTLIAELEPAKNEIY